MTTTDVTTKTYNNVVVSSLVADTGQPSMGSAAERFVGPGQLEFRKGKGTRDAIGIMLVLAVLGAYNIRRPVSPITRKRSTG